MKKLLLILMLGLVTIAGYQLNEGVAWVDNDYPDSQEVQV